MCMIDESEDYWDFHDATIRKARKQYKCIECRKIINIGEKYERVTGKLHCSKTIEQYKTCSFCLEVKEWLIKECGGYLYYGVLEDIQEHASEYRSMKLWRMVVNMRTQWRHEIKFKELRK